MLLIELSKKPSSKVRRYFTLTPDVINKLELAAITHRISTGSRKTRPSHIVEWLIQTNAIAVGVDAIKSRAEELEKKAVDKWEGITIHGQHKTKYGVMLRTELYRKLRDEALKVNSSASELIEWTVREDGLDEMNRRLQGK